MLADITHIHIRLLLLFFFLRLFLDRLKAMDDSMINPILLSSSMHLKNAEKLIQNLENITSKDEQFLLESIQLSNERFSIDSFLHDNLERSSGHHPSTSWKQMKESQRIMNENSSKHISSPLNLYKIFRRRSTNLTSPQSSYSLSLLSVHSSPLSFSHTIIEPSSIIVPQISS